MCKIIHNLLLLFTLCMPSISYSLTLTDDFNDGDLQGWTMKQGVWSNPGDHMLSSTDNYGIIWKDDSVGYDQSIKIDAYFDGAYGSGGTSKTAQLRLRSGDAGYGPNPFFDHGYMAVVLINHLSIRNAVQPYFQHTIAVDNSTILTENTWHTIEFTVTGSGNNTYLELWIDGQLYLSGYDTSGYAHDDGGYVALGSSNHINRTIKYDNFEAYVQTELSHALELLQTTIDNLGSAGDVVNSYDANLKKVEFFIEIEEVTPAINNLNAFIRKVEHDVEQGKVSAIDGDSLIIMATGIITQLTE